MYIDVPERTKNLVAAAYDISGFSFYLKHSDAKSNYHFEGKKLTELKMKIYNMLPDSSFTSVETAGRYIDSLIKVRKRRLKKFRHCGDENGNDVKWRPITESLLDNIEKSDAHSSDVLSANATDGNPLDYNNFYLFNIETEVDIEPFCEDVRPIFDKYKINYMFKTYTRSEIRELPWVDLQKETHFMRSDKFLCFFFDKFPVTMVGRVQWLLKIITVYIQEFSDDVSIYRFEKNDSDIFILKSKGHVVRTWYKGYFGLYDGPDRKLFDDTLFVSQFSILLNTSNHTIYFEIKPILKKIRERFLDWKSKKLTESVLDDLEHNEITQNDIVRAKQQALYYDEMYLFNVVPGNTEIISPLELIGDLADAMDIDIYMELYDEGDFDDVEYVYHRDDDSFQTSSQLCVYINQPTSDYDKAKFLIMLMEIISHEYEVGTDVRLYRKNSRDMFEMNKRIERTMMQIYNMWCLRIRDIKEGRDVQSLMSYGSTIAVYQDVCNLLYFNTNPKMNCVERAIRNLMKRPMFMNESRLNESILDNVERTSTDSAADLSGKSTDDDEDKFDFHKYERFTHMFQFCVSGESDNSSLIEFLNARGIDYEILQAGSDEWKSIDWISRNIALNDEPDTYLGVFVNLPARMYYRLRLIMGICSAVCDDYNDAVGNDIYKYVLENVSRNEKMFICRAVARQVVVRSDQLNNYFNGGSTFSDRNESHV